VDRQDRWESSENLLAPEWKKGRAAQVCPERVLAFLGNGGKPLETPGVEKHATPGVVRVKV